MPAFSHYNGCAFYFMALKTVRRSHRKMWQVRELHFQKYFKSVHLHLFFTSIKAVVRAVSSWHNSALPWFPHFIIPPSCFCTHCCLVRMLSGGRRKIKTSPQFSEQQPQEARHLTNTLECWSLIFRSFSQKCDIQKGKSDVLTIPEVPKTTILSIQWIIPSTSSVYTHHFCLIPHS